MLGVWAEPILSALLADWRRLCERTGKRLYLPERTRGTA